MSAEEQSRPVGLCSKLRSKAKPAGRIAHSVGSGGERKVPRIAARRYGELAERFSRADESDAVSETTRNNRQNMHICGGEHPQVRAYRPDMCIVLRNNYG